MDHPLRTTLEEVIYWKENPVNTDRVGTVPFIGAFKDIVPKKHLIGKASLPLCCKTTFTSTMSRPSIGIARETKLAASPEPTPLLLGTFFEEELKQTRSLFTDGSKTAEGPFGGFAVFDYHENKGWGYGHHKSPPYSTRRQWPSPSLTPVSTKCKAITLVYSRTPGADGCYLIVQGLWKEIPTHLPH
jgi:hypothetical protein